MMTYGERAAKNFTDGYNCAQAVLLTFSDLTKLDTDTALRLSSSFGGGMGRLREVCGAVSGMFMVAGLLCGQDSLVHEQKMAHYARIQALAAKFREQNGSIICRELIKGTEKDPSYVPEKRTPEYYKKRPCAMLCADAADILAQYIKENPLSL